MCVVLCLCIWVVPCVSTHRWAAACLHSRACVLACEGPELILEVSLNRSSPYIEVGFLSWTQNSPTPCDELLGGYGNGLTGCMATWRVAREMMTRGWARKLFTRRQGEHIWACSPELGFGRPTEECVEGFSPVQEVDQISPLVPSN